jgi:hypothetical protein
MGHGSDSKPFRGVHRGWYQLLDKLSAQTHTPLRPSPPTVDSVYKVTESRGRDRGRGRGIVGAASRHNKAPDLGMHLRVGTEGRRSSNVNESSWQLVSA